MRPGENCDVAPYADIERVAVQLMDAIRTPERSEAIAARGRKTAAQYTQESFRRSWVEEFRAILPDA